MSVSESKYAQEEGILHSGTAEKESVWLATRSSLLKRLKGDVRQASWQEFYGLYWRAIYGYALRFAIPKDDAEDVVQEVFIKILRQLPAFEYDRAKGRFLSWVKTITRTTAMDYFRRRQARVEGHMRTERADETILDNTPAATCDQPPDPWEEEWQKSLLAVAFENVGRRVRKTTCEAFRLTAIEDRPAEDAAAMLGISVEAVYVNRSRMIRHLRAEVTELQKRA